MHSLFRLQWRHRTLRSDNGNANENVGETLKLFRPYTKSPSYLKVRKLGGNWREGTASEFRESKMYRLAVPFLQSTQNLSFHVVVVARTAEKCTKRRAELSFFVCSLCRRRRSFVRSLMNGQRGPCPFHWTGKIDWRNGRIHLVFYQHFFTSFPLLFW